MLKLIKSSMTKDNLTMNSLPATDRDGLRKLMRTDLKTKSKKWKYRAEAAKYTLKRRREKYRKNS